MASELDVHDILFNPLKTRRAQLASRRAADQKDPSVPPPRSDREAPATDRAVAYAIQEADTGPLVSPRLIAGIAVVAAIATAAVLMRKPELRESAVDESGIEESHWWTTARQQWANETMRLWPIAVRGKRPPSHMAATSAEAKSANLNGAPSAAPSKATVIEQPAAPPPPPVSGALPNRTPSTPSTGGSDNPYADTARAAPRAPAKPTDNPYADAPTPSPRKPAAGSNDNPY